LQATLTSFQPKQAEEWGCKTCVVRHRFLEHQGKIKVKCDLMGYKDMETHCRCHWTENPLQFWPELPDNYEVPLKYRAKW
jgi:hypothetical protein